jgi:Xaa-Pro aminopeptidase
MTRRLLLVLAAASLAASPARPARAQSSTAVAVRPFGTLRDQAARQQRWLEQRMTTILPRLMRESGIDLWVVPMREYNEDPVFTSLVSPTTFAARRRTIYVFRDRGVVGGVDRGVERIALGGSSQGGVYEAVRATKPVPVAVGPTVAPGSGNTTPTAELWGDEQWQVLKALVERVKPRVIGIDVSRTFAFSDGLSAGELAGMSEALGVEWTRRFRHAESLPLALIATRLPDEEAAFRDMNRLAWEIIREAFSERVITPGVTRTEDVVWWMRQRVNDLGLGSWFQPSVEVQRRGATAAQLGDSPVIQRGDVLHCDFGLTAMRLNTDTQHMGYVLLPGEIAPPAGLRAALAASNRLQDIVVAELRPGRTGNEILRASLTAMRAAGIDGTVYSHPIGMHGHGAGPLIGLWDYQDGVPGRGDARVTPSMWYSIELQATTPVPEWGGQRVRSAQEEDVIIGADGRVRFAFGRQTEFHLVR